MKDEGGRMSQKGDMKRAMAPSANLGILEWPLQPGFFRQCLKCGRLFALKLIRKEESDLCGTVRTFRCKHCGHEHVFADQHPPGVL